MWSESSTAHCLFFLVFQKIKQPQFVSAVQTTPVHFRLLFFRVKSYREGKILLGVPNVWGCSKYSCSISMGINAVVISVTCCGQTLSLCPNSYWHRSPNYLFIQCFWSLGLLAVWCDQSAPGLCWKGLSKQARCVLVTHPITCATCSGCAQISRKEANEPITLTNVKSRIVKLTLWACSLFSVNVNQSGILSRRFDRDSAAALGTYRPWGVGKRLTLSQLKWYFDLDNLVLQNMYVLHGGWDWEISNVIWTEHSDYCVVINFPFNKKKAKAIFK